MRLEEASQYVAIHFENREIKVQWFWEKMQFLKAVLKLMLLGISVGGLPSMEDFVPPPASPQVFRNLTSMLSLIMRVLMFNTIWVLLLDSVGDYFCVSKD